VLTAKQLQAMLRLEAKQRQATSVSLLIVTKSSRERGKAEGCSEERESLRRDETNFIFDAGYC